MDKEARMTTVLRMQRSQVGILSGTPFRYKTTNTCACGISACDGAGENLLAAGDLDGFRGLSS